jgi:hypothetical protein
MIEEPEVTERTHPEAPEQSGGLPQAAKAAREGSSERTPGSAGAESPGQLNESQKRRLSVTCEYIDRLLAEIEVIVRAAAPGSPFPRYVVNLDAEQVRSLDDSIRRLRVELVRALAWQQMAPAPPQIPATRAVLTNLHFIDIAIEELRPRYLRGCGPVPENVLADLNAVIVSLRAIAEEMVHSLVRSMEEKDREADSKPEV